LKKKEKRKKAVLTAISPLKKKKAVLTAKFPLKKKKKKILK